MEETAYPNPETYFPGGPRRRGSGGGPEHPLFQGVEAGLQLLYLRHRHLDPTRQPAPGSQSESSEPGRRSKPPTARLYGSPRVKAREGENSDAVREVSHQVWLSSLSKLYGRSFGWMEGHRPDVSAQKTGSDSSLPWRRAEASRSVSGPEASAARTRVPLSPARGGRFPVCEGGLFAWNWNGRRSNLLLAAGFWRAVEGRGRHLDRFDLQGLH